IVTYDNGFGDACGMAILREPTTGDILVVGEDRISNLPMDRALAIWRYDATGAPVTAFGTNGVVRYDTPGDQQNDDDSGEAIAIDGSGNILVAGYAPNASGNADMVLLSYSPSGVLNTGFGTGGVASYDGGYDDYGYDMVIDASGNILVTGRSDNGTNEDLAVWRFTSSGVPDTGFGTNGVVKITHSAGLGITLDSAGKILVTGG
ncbi:MAG: NHL repeat-containing protein, partial [Planctomycetota bacterium]